MGESINTEFKIKKIPLKYYDIFGYYYIDDNVIGCDYDLPTMDMVSNTIKKIKKEYGIDIDTSTLQLIDSSDISNFTDIIDYQDLISLQGEGYFNSNDFKKSKALHNMSYKEKRENPEYMGYINSLYNKIGKKLTMKNNKEMTKAEWNSLHLKSENKKMTLNKLVNMIQESIYKTLNEMNYYDNDDVSLSLSKSGSPNIRVSQTSNEPNRSYIENSDKLPKKETITDKCDIFTVYRKTGYYGDSYVIKDTHNQPAIFIPYGDKEIPAGINGTIRFKLGPGGCVTGELDPSTGKVYNIFDYMVKKDKFKNTKDYMENKPIPYLNNY